MKWWKEYPWRMLQTNFREKDFDGIDIDRFVNDVKNFHATVLLLNAGGISASYPTKLLCHSRNPYIKGNELKEIVKLCHDQGIHVLARTDFSKIKKDLFIKHPEWAFRDENGRIMEYNGYVQTCLNSIYQQEYAFKILKEIFDTIPFDGLFCNMGGFQTRDYDFKDYGFCHCESCRNKFKEETGCELPEKEDFYNPDYIQYTLFQKKVLTAYRKKIVHFLKGYKRDLCFDDEEYGRIEASTELKRKLPHFPYLASSNCRVIRGDGSSGIICSDTSVEYAGYGMRDISVSPQLQAIRLWQNLVNLGALDYYFMGRPDNHLDRCSFKKIKEIFLFHSLNERYYKGLHSKARVLLRRQDRWVATEEEKGIIRVLTESHIPFAEILPWEFPDANLKAYDILLLPDSPYLTEEEEKKIDAYVSEGGRLLLSGESDLSDDKKGSKNTYGLSCTGIKRVIKTDRNMMSAMLLSNETDKLVFRSSPDTDVYGIGDIYLYLETEGDCTKLLSMIPPHPYGPPECCGFTEITEYPGAVVHKEGKGTAVTVPWYPGTFYSRTGCSNPFYFIKDLLINVCGAQSLSEKLTPMVETGLAEYEDGSLLLQLVNNSGCFSLSFFEPVPVRETELLIKTGFMPKCISALRGGTVRWEKKEDQLLIKLDELKDYEALFIQK